jgi:hypothetical protein
VNKGELLDMLAAAAAEYSPGANASVRRNRHMNKYRGPAVDQAFVDAVLVDFLNHVGHGQGMDFGMYTADLARRRAAAAPASAIVAPQTNFGSPEMWGMTEKASATPETTQPPGPDRFAHACAHTLGTHVVATDDGRFYGKCGAAGCPCEGPAAIIAAAPPPPTSPGRGDSY